MGDSIRILAEVQGDVTEFRALIRHPMETGLRKDEKTGKEVPAHFIQEVIVEHNGKQVFKALWGSGISANPYLSFKFKGGKIGDGVKLSWVDNKDQSDFLIAKLVKAD